MPRAKKINCFRKATGMCSSLCIVLLCTMLILPMCQYQTNVMLNSTGPCIMPTTTGISPLRRSRRGGMAKVEEYVPGVSGMSEGPPAPKDIFRHDG